MIKGQNAKDARRRKRERASFFKFLAFVGPHLLIFSVFVLIPIIYGLVVSFTRWDFTSAPVFAGLDNYKALLTDSGSTYYRQFHDGLVNTLKFVVFNVPVCIALPLVLALLLHTKCAWSRFFQSSIYIPTLFSITSVGIIWMQLLNKRYGIFSGFDLRVALTTQLPYAWYSLIAMSSWWTIGANMVIYQAALGGVPAELYESASLDGANFLQKSRYISLPSIRFQLLFTLVTTIAGSFNVYGQPAILTQSGTGGTPKIWVLTMYIKDLAFGAGQPIAGMASAMAILLGLMIIVFSFLQFRLISKE